jgi:hypothetical protein
MKWHLVRIDLVHLKTLVREIYGSLPMLELMTNKLLILELENVETQFRSLMNELYEQ